MAGQQNKDDGLQARWTRTPAPNSTHKKLAVQRLNEAFVPRIRIQCWQTV